MTRRRTDEPAPASQATETFVPAVSFTGYPNGKTAVEFVAGVESFPVSPAYAQLIRDKGLVADV